MATHDSKQRFSNRVEDYVKYRPGYPTAVIDHLQQQYQLLPGKMVADIGAGTGISSALFLEAGYPVTAVEPNPEMREKAIVLLSHYPGFRAVDGSAEQTGLESGSMDAVVAGQAFHWFDRNKARAEFSRVLKPHGMVALIWNERLQDAPFEKEYDQLINRHGKDYVKVDHRNIGDDGIGEFFSPQPVQLTTFPNQQIFDFDGLKGRLLSSSYMPVASDPGYEEMIRDLQQLFDRYQQHNTITIRYMTKLYTGVL